MNLQVPALALVLAGCGTTSTPQATPAPPAAPATPAVAPAPPSPPDEPSAETIPANRFSVHEWGLVDVALDGRIDLRTGRPRTDLSSAVARKPVLYVHLGSALTEQQLSVSARISGGQVIEHWPTGELTSDTVRWRNLVARSGPCGGITPEPARDLQRSRRLPVCDTSDGYCEVRELARYVTDDAACLSIGSMAAPLLFYRGAAPRAELPIEFARGVIRLRGPSTFGRTPRTLVQLARRNGRVLAQIGQLPEAQQSLTLSPPTVPVNATELRAALDRDLRALGLTASEVNAFLNAWFEELTGTGASASRETPPLPPEEDVLLYWLPSDHARAIAELTIEPAPAGLRRALLVRVRVN